MTANLQFVNNEFMILVLGFAIIQLGPLYLDSDFAWFLAFLVQSCKFSCKYSLVNKTHMKGSITYV